MRNEPAFPQSWENDSDKDVPLFGGTVAPGKDVIFFGLTIRDYFAAKAMQAHYTAMVAEDGCDFTDSDIAKWSYKAADAMLKERK